jgi:hypothetical protein
MKCQLGTCAAPTGVYGRVSAGATPEGVTVRIDNLAATTDANGDYRIDDVAPGTKTVTASREYFLPAKATVSVAAGSSTRVDLSLTAVGEIHGRVTDSLTGAGIGSVVVTLGPLVSYTATDGNYYIVDVPPGSYWLHFTSRGYSPAQSLLAVPGGTLTTVDRVLDKTGSISGRVTSAAGGAPVAGATVLADGAVGKTSGTGQYSLDGVFAGSVPVLVTAAGFDASTSIVTVKPSGSAVADFSLATASTKPTNITGHVTNAETSAPLAGAYVSIGTKSATTGADGSYSLIGVTPDPQAYVSASLTGFQNMSFRMAIAGDASLVQDFGMKPYHTVYVVATDALTRAPISNASISAGGGSCTTSAAGWCSMQAVSGPTTLGVYATGYRLLSTAVEFASMAASMLTAELTPVPRVCGVVRNAATTAPLAGASVDLLVGATPQASTVSAVDGTYCIPCPETYAQYTFTWTASGSSPGFTNNGASFQFPPTGTIDLDLPLWPAGSAP